MTQMAGTQISPSVFAYNWLANWALSTTVNGDPLSAVRPANPVDNSKSLPLLIYEAWQRASGGTVGGDIKLAMNKAPFRLLAIANRFDLRNNRRFGEGVSGELRFVFSVLDLDNAGDDEGTCRQYPATTSLGGGEEGVQLLILEYAVDLSGQAQIDWARRWADLTYTSPEEPAYRDELQALTEMVVRAGAGGSRPNGSALIRIRTNETADFNEWDLREFNISASTKFPVPVTVKQTPSVLLNGTDDLGRWMNANASNIHAPPNDTYVVPDTFPTGQGYANTNFLGSHGRLQSSNTFWSSSSGVPVDSETRHAFSLNTCSGCHSRETGGLFFHVHGRHRAEVSEISSFLSGVDNSGNPFCVTDPLLPNIARCFSELQRRADDLNNFVNGQP
jgi:hypothetical protein